MPSFTVTSAGQKVPLEKDGAGQAAFTVTNTTTGTVRGRVLISALPPAEQSWFSIVGPTTFEFAPGEARNVTAQIAVPKGTKPGTYSFRCDAVAEENPDEDYTEGPAVSFDVAAEESHKGFPWWIVAVAAIVILGLIAGIVLATRGDDNTPTTPTSTIPPVFTIPQKGEVTIHPAIEHILFQSNKVNHQVSINGDIRVVELFGAINDGSFSFSGSRTLEPEAPPAPIVAFERCTDDYAVHLLVEGQLTNGAVQLNGALQLFDRKKGFSPFEEEKSDCIGSDGIGHKSFGFQVPDASSMSAEIETEGSGQVNAIATLDVSNKGGG